MLRGRKFTDRTFPTNDALYWADYEYERNERVARLTYEYEKISGVGQGCVEEGLHRLI